MKRSDDLKQQLLNLTNEVKELNKAGKVEEAHDKIKAVKELQNEIEVELILESQEAEVEPKAVTPEVANSAKILRTFVKDFANMKLSDEESKILNENKRAKTGVNNEIVGEEYILPSDVSTKIKEKVRNSKCFKNYLGHISTVAQNGSFVVDNTVAHGLVDMVDGTAIADTQDLSFSQVTFSLKEKAGFIPLTNTVLKFTDNNLIEFVVRLFAKRAIVTYNAMAVATLKTGKTVKAIADVKALVKELRVTIDPDMLEGAVVVTNQDGLQKIADKEDLKGVSYIQPDLTKPATLCVNGVPVVVFSNAQLKTVEGKAPIFAGNLVEGASFVDAGTYNFASSSEAGFMQNVTWTRVIDYVDCVQKDASDSVYIVGELAL